MAIDLAPMWDFAQPELSEQRFRAALASARGDDALILQTQIARSFGLRRQFDQAREVLAGLEPEIGRAGPEARARHALELGRTHVSATHPPATLTDDARSAARAAYGSALAIARGAGLDGLSIDTLHMMAFVDTAPAEQLRWGQEALAISLASSQPEAQRWEASLRNNIGMALHQVGRYDDALAHFRQALALRERGADPERVRVAQWMVAWTLRALGRLDEAIALQLQLERDSAAAGAPDPYVFEELEILYRSQGDTARAAHYAALRKPRP